MFVEPEGNYANVSEHENQMSSFEAAFKESNLNQGDFGWFQSIDEEADKRAVKALPNYNDYKEEYEAFATDGNWVGLVSDREADRSIYNSALKNKVFELDDNDNVIKGEGYGFGAELLFNDTKMKGYLLANKYGYDRKKHYQELVNEEMKHIEKADKGMFGRITGTISGFIAQSETIQDIALSPGYIGGKTIFEGVTKAFGLEALAAFPGELQREKKRRYHEEMMNNNVSIAESATNILLNSSIAGVIRAGGSAVVDAFTIRSLKKEFPDAASQDILEKFATIQEEKIVTNNNFYVTNKARADFEQGKKVDITEFADKEPTPDVEPVDLNEEISKHPDVIQDNEVLKKLEVQIEQEIEVEAKLGEAEELTPDEQLILDEMIDDPRMFEDDPELEARIRELETEYQIQFEEAEAAQRAEEGTQFKPQTMTINGEEINKTDFDLVQKYKENRKFNRENPTKKRNIPDDQVQAYERNKNIADDLLDVDFKQDQEFKGSLNQTGDLLDENGNILFANFGDNIAAGTFAGVETDEDGNITFDPEKFALGLGGYTAVKQMWKAGLFDNLPEEINKQVKKYFGVDLEPNIIDGDKPKSFLERSRAKTQAKIDRGVIPEAGRRVQHPRASNGSYFLGDSGKVYFESRGKWKEMANQDVVDEVNEITKIGYRKFVEKEKQADEELNTSMKKAEEREAAKEDSYKDAHTAPTRDQENATSIDDLTAIYPSDIYENNAARYYGHGNEAEDKAAIKILQRIKNKPKAKVTIYRSIPEDVDADINAGDWVTITKQYAIDHAENRFKGKYKLLTKEVNAEDIITDGNSIHEQGYDPKEIK